MAENLHDRDLDFPWTKTHHRIVSDWLTKQSIYQWPFGWLVGWLSDWLIDWLVGWLVDWLTDWLIDWLIDWLVYVDDYVNPLKHRTLLINWSVFQYWDEIWFSYISYPICNYTAISLITNHHYLYRWHRPTLFLVKFSGATNHVWVIDWKHACHSQTHETNRFKAVQLITLIKQIIVQQCLQLYI